MMSVEVKGENYTKNQLYLPGDWAVHIPIDPMWSSCAVGIVGGYIYTEPADVIRNVAGAFNAGSPYEQTIMDKVHRMKIATSSRRAFLIFADGYEGRDMRNGKCGGPALADYIEKHKLGKLASPGPGQNINYGTRAHACQCWVWLVDWDAVDKHVEEIGPVGSTKKKELF